MNIIERLRRRVTPPCSKCRWGVNDSYGRVLLCENPKGLDLQERMDLICDKRMNCLDVRGTNYCNFKAKEVDDDRKS